MTDTTDYDTDWFEDDTPDFTSGFDEPVTADEMSWGIPVAQSRYGEFLDWAARHPERDPRRARTR